MTNLMNMTFDDRDPHLKYLGPWFNTGTWNASNVGLTGTLSSTNSLSANVTFTFPTPAIAFYYYGIQRSRGGFYGICIDCDPNNPQWVDIDAVNRTDDGKNPPVVLFSKTFTVPAVHEIIIRNQNDTRFDNSQLTIDRIDLEVAGPSTTSSSSSQGTSSTPGNPSSTAPTSSIPSSPNTSGASSQSSSPIGAIAGGVIGGLAIILLAILIFIWLRRGKRFKKIPQTRTDLSSIVVEQPGQSEAHLVEPYVMRESNAGSFSGNFVSMYPQPASETGVVTRPSMRKAPRPGHTPNPSTTLSTADSISTSTGPASGASEPSTTSSRRSRVRRREVDAGPVSIGINEDEEDDEDDTRTLPPDYGDVFADNR
ncbi:hypothetical protein M422DRAFT_72422 [Sphaerobolus stellatus SS14]|uniref:Mid2 domain-containing protein n=1 Tax=Sphaerobolus stellatus (strain SS14) TaxID=990650 RepID=A0A0C9U4P8_SPHS4|nr:hypothetical protein M422DRAFT_72422 [Sphaerobolus stellatus SS14]